jgi:hypothetical protein
VNYVAITIEVGENFDDLPAIGYQLERLAAGLNPNRKITFLLLGISMCLEKLVPNKTKVKGTSTIVVWRQFLAAIALVDWQWDVQLIEAPYWLLPGTMFHQGLQKAAGRNIMLRGSLPTGLLEKWQSRLSRNNDRPRFQQR